MSAESKNRLLDVLLAGCTACALLLIPLSFQVWLNVHWSSGFPLGSGAISIEGNELSGLTDWKDGHIVVAAGLAAAFFGTVSLALRRWQHMAAIAMVVAGTIVLAVAGYDAGHNWRPDFSMEHFSADQVDVTISLWITLVLGLILCLGGLTTLVLRNSAPRRFQTDAAHA